MFLDPGEEQLVIIGLPMISLMVVKASFRFLKQSCGGGIDYKIGSHLNFGWLKADFLLIRHFFLSEIVHFYSEESVGSSKTRSFSGTM